MNEMTK